MNAKQATFAVLNGMSKGDEISGSQLGLRAWMASSCEGQHYISTYLRYMREWRALGYTPCVECVSKPKSLYRVI